MGSRGRFAGGMAQRVGGWFGKLLSGLRRADPPGRGVPGGTPNVPATPVRVTPGQSLPHNPMDLVPPGANRRTLRPDPAGGAQDGVEYKWTQDGQTIRMRGHGPDGTAPPGSNAASGDTYRVQVGGRYMDTNGNLHPRGVHNPDSPNYDPAAANETHIPWPSDVPRPWRP